jgi:HK97 family phage major capsid protein
MFNRSKLRAFAGPGGEEKANRFGMFVKALAGQQAAKEWCIQSGVGLTKAASEGINSAGGFLTEQAVDAAIIRVVETFGAFRQGADIRPTGTDGQVRPRHVGGLTANFVAEGTSIPESSLLLDAVETTQKGLKILARGSIELLQDSAPVLGEYIAWEMGYAFAGKEDDSGLNGDGSSGFAGISGLATKLVGTKSSVAAAAGHNTFVTLDTSDIANLMGGVLAAAIPRAAWYVSATAYAQTICRLAAVSGGLRDVAA